MNGLKSEDKILIHKSFVTLLKEFNDVQIGWKLPKH